MYQKPKRHVKNSTGCEQVPGRSAAVDMVIQVAISKAALDHADYLLAVVDRRLTPHDMRVLRNVHSRVPYFTGLVCAAQAHCSLCVLKGLGYVADWQLAECVA